MHIHIEARNEHSIRSYNDAHIIVGETTYEQSIIVSKELILPWSITSFRELSLPHLTPLIESKPEIILIGHRERSAPLPVQIMAQLSKDRIGMECMDIGAACRTFNVLLAEGRNVFIGLILSCTKYVR